MNRRTYLKGIGAALTLGLVSVPAYKWISMNRPVNAAVLKEKEHLIAELAELIIPETDTPGAKRAGVAAYIIGVMGNCMDVRQQNKFVGGIEKLEEYCLAHYEKEFLMCSESQKQEVLTYFADHDGYPFAILNKINNKFLGGSFYNTLKNLTVEGYCTSMLGATQGLAYDYIPGTFEACIPLRPGQKSWATK
ncbi:gluconate 2-dehydrogenase subunit 3 family protein [Pedobacter africanus]|uniref:Gluconate 2-dehydrogenase subunit 3 n=1 Tax=Pedobacter africanus TaxID=151894 RepID=A0A1W2DF19_9SPHI|nr:gluconate 2-dehydrogenase subunit 3 family protein [Pedobacter africanus]SMC96053.1 Gluconate 2-dehydrogenase subunit 3 [Pedobacter africanus]